MRRLWRRVLETGLVAAAVASSVLTGPAPSSAAVPPFTDSTTWAYLSNPRPAWSSTLPARATSALACRNGATVRR